MKFKIKNQLSQTLYAILRETGYQPIHDHKTGKDSYVRKLSSGHYPRFHLYLTEATEIVFDLHLDQNVNRYQNQTAHNADHDSPEVKEELTRIYGFVRKYLLEK